MLTHDPIISVMITYDSTTAVTVVKKNDREYWVKQYSLSDHSLTFEEMIGGTPTSYIKLKEVEQNATGSKFALTYLDDGIFRLRTFSKEKRT